MVVYFLLVSGCHGKPEYCLLDKEKKKEFCLFHKEKNKDFCKSLNKKNVQKGRDGHFPSVLARERDEGNRRNIFTKINKE